MRVLIANWHQQVVGGAESYLCDLVPALQSRGYEVRFLVENVATSGERRIDQAGNSTTWVVDSQNSKSVLNEVAAWPADVCFLHGLVDPGLQEWLLDRLPTVLFAHNYHGTCISGTKRYGFPAEESCTRTFGAGCLVRYYPRRCGGLHPINFLRDYQIQAARNRLLSRYAAVVVASQHMVHEFERHGVPRDRIHRIPLFPIGNIPESPPQIHRPFTGRLCFVGRLTAIKGGSHAVKATRIAGDSLGRPLTLVVIGNGPALPHLQALARREQVVTEFPGWVATDRRDKLLRGADLLVFPSTWPEPFGLIGIEAGRLGVPAVAFAVGGVLDWLRPGVSGEIAPGTPCRSEELAGAICRALADPLHWARLCVGAWETAQTFDRGTHVDALVRVLTTAASSFPHPLSLELLPRDGAEV